MSPRAGWRWTSAIWKASMARSARRCSAIAQPTTLREQPSSTGGWGQPALPVGMQEMSAYQSGPARPGRTAARPGRMPGWRPGRGGSARGDGAGGSRPARGCASTGRPACGPPASRGRRAVRRAPWGAVGATPVTVGLGDLLQHGSSPSRRRQRLFLSISRSWRSTWFSRRSRPSSSRWVVVSSPGRPWPVSTSAWCSQLRRVCPETPRSAASSGMVLPLVRASSTARRGCRRVGWSGTWARELLRGLTALKRLCIQQIGTTPVSERPARKHRPLLNRARHGARSRGAAADTDG
jgi:hypothetical protein